MVVISIMDLDKVLDMLLENSIIDSFLNPGPTFKLVL